MSTLIPHALIIPMAPPACEHTLPSFQPQPPASVSAPSVVLAPTLALPAAQDERCSLPGPAARDESCVGLPGRLESWTERVVQRGSPARWCGRSSRASAGCIAACSGGVAAAGIVRRPRWQLVWVVIGEWPRKFGFLVGGLNSDEGAELSGGPADICVHR